MSAACVAALGLRCIGERNVQHIATAGVTRVRIYPLRLSFPDLRGASVDLKDEGVVEGLVPDPDELGGPVHVLVGRDVLAFFTLTVDGRRGFYTLGS